MKIEIGCIPCFVRQAVEAVSATVGDPARVEAILRKVLHAIGDTDWLGSPPVVGQRIHRIIRQELGCRDPYREIKGRMNRMASEIMPGVAQAMALQPNRHEAAVRLAIGGNLMDSGAKTQIGPEELPRVLQTIWTRPLCGDVAALFREAQEARCILYLTDNAGEIFFDRQLIAALPAGKIVVAVRGAPVINDATVEDAAAAGLPDVALVLDNGSDAPGTILEDCCEEFRRWFERADLVIAKGQGNYESLSGTTKRIFFLFTVKCPVVAAHVGQPVGSLVVVSRGAHE